MISVPIRGFEGKKQLSSNLFITTHWAHENSNQNTRIECLFFLFFFHE